MLKSVETASAKSEVSSDVSILAGNKSSSESDLRMLRLFGDAGGIVYTQDDP
jgi:hypothetical protein